MKLYILILFSITSCALASKSVSKCKGNELIYDVVCNKENPYCFVFLDGKYVAIVDNPGLNSTYAFCGPALSQPTENPHYSHI